MNNLLNQSLLLLLLTSLVLSVTATAQSIEEIEKQVADAERAFAQSMADRNFDKFKTFIDDDAVFVSSNATARGKQKVAQHWQRYFESDQAPFAWKPETVVVISSGDIALSTGPVWNPDGDIYAYYTSTWRKNAAGEWKVILDKGQKYCPP